MVINKADKNWKILEPKIAKTETIVIIYIKYVKKGMGWTIWSFIIWGSSMFDNFAERIKSCLNSKANFGMSL